MGSPGALKGHCSIYQEFARPPVAGWAGRGKARGLTHKREEIGGLQSRLINTRLPRTNVSPAAVASDSKKSTVNATYLCASCQLAGSQPISFKKRDIYFHPFRSSQFISDHHQLKKLYKLAALFFFFLILSPTPLNIIFLSLFESV